MTRIPAAAIAIALAGTLWSLPASAQSIGFGLGNGKSRTPPPADSLPPPPSLKRPIHVETPGHRTGTQAKPAKKSQAAGNR